MRTHTQAFEEELVKLGKQQKVLISYGNTTLSNDVINSVTYSFDTTLLKSIMTCLEIDSNVEIPKDTEINFKYGLLINGAYEYLDYGQFIVSEVEKQEDTISYKIVAFDKMIYAMQDYEPLEVEYPISNTDFFEELVGVLGYTLPQSYTLDNGDKLLPYDVFDGIGYTYRDVLDDIAEANGVNFIMNDDVIEIKRVEQGGGFIRNETLLLEETSEDVSNKTLTLSKTPATVSEETLEIDGEGTEIINEDYLKDINVNFGALFGPINSVVLSRSAEDNIYQKDDASIIQNGLFEIKITDNQILNNNDRGDYLPAIYNALHGLSFSLNDYKSIGICYLEPLENYSVKIGDNVYPCVLWNDEIDITQGLEENIYTEAPVQSQTDYKKATTTEHETSLIVDKAKKQIQSLITEVGDRTNKTTSITQDIDTIVSQVEVLADVTEEKQDNGALQFDDVNMSEPLYVQIKPIDRWISYLYPYSGLFPSSATYLESRIIRFENTKTEEIVDYELPCDLRFVDDTRPGGMGFVTDEFILDYENQICKKIERIGIDAGGEAYIYNQSQIREIDFDYPQILLTEGDYTISLLAHSQYYLKVKVNKVNDYTRQFATRVELSSTIEQTTNMINLELDEKVNNEDYTSAQILLKINEDESLTQIKADKISLEGKTIELTSDNISINSQYFQVDKNGRVTCQSLAVTGTESYINLNDAFVVDNLGNVKIYDEGWRGSQRSAQLLIQNEENSNMFTGIYSNYFEIIQTPREQETWGGPGYIEMNDNINGDYLYFHFGGGMGFYFGDVSGSIFYEPGGGLTADGYIYAANITSDKSLKKNIKDSKVKALDEIKKIKHREFDWKKDNKHEVLGYVAQELEEVDPNLTITHINREGEELHYLELKNIVALSTKAIQELAEEVEELKSGKANNN